MKEREAKWNLQCERKFAYFIFLDQTKRNYNIQELSEDGLYPSYSEVSNNLTPMILNKHKCNVTNDELWSFVQIMAQRVIRGTTLTFLNVPVTRKDGLLTACIKRRNHPHHQQSITIALTLLVLLEQELFSNWVII